MKGPFVALVLVALCLSLSPALGQSDGASDGKISKPRPTLATPPPPPAGTPGELDFGDDAGEWARDDECDDPRFAGPGMALFLADENILHDATDCRALFESGDIALAPLDETAPAEPVTPTEPVTPVAPAEPDGPIMSADGTVDFGDNAGDWVNDDECDDPRFAGEGMASTLLDEDIMHDADDCKALYDAGKIALAPAVPDGPIMSADGTVDFGDDAGDWANDDECDDPRFAGEGMARTLVDEDLMHDASDCKALYDAGKIALAPPGPAESDGPIMSDDGTVDFGDNASEWANDDECDDPRFAGDGMASTLLEEDQMHDASDCKALYDAGSITLASAPPSGESIFSADGSIEFGNNASSWANNDECDDLRFTGAAMASTLISEDQKRDADDCKAAFEANTITLIPVFHPGYVKGAPYDAGGIDFGDDTSTYANNAECDDPRFVGPSMASAVLDEDERRDATDCREAFTSGLIALR